MAELIASTYEIIERIGSGGGGIAYLANHTRLNKKVVLKADKRKLTTRPEILRREVDALKDLSHTYIPQVYDFFVEGETVYTVMDYIEGESLDKPLKRGERFSQPQVIRWACELLEALCYLHEPTHGTPPRGIVHSDIKPANIMRTPRGDICLIDFNIALALGEENVIGRSPGYASPEHYGLDFSVDSFSETDSTTEAMSEATEAMSEETEAISEETEVMSEGAEKTEVMDEKTPVRQSEYSSSSKRVVIPDVRSDIYSLGATLYHLLSGQRPAKSAMDVVPLSDKEFSPLIVKIIMKAMSPNPDMRYQTAEEMLYAFTHLRENDPRTKRRKKMCVIVSTILSAMLIGSMFLSFTGLKRMETAQKSLALAEYAQNALASGDTRRAVAYALEALPQKRGIFVPPFAAPAQKALADALGVYDLSDGYKPHCVPELPSEAFQITLSPDGKTAAASYAFAAAVFDTETGTQIAQLPMVRSALADIVFLDNQTMVYAGEDGISAYDVKEKRVLWSGRLAAQIAVSADGQTIAGVYRDENFAVVYDRNGVEKTVVSFGENKQRVVENDTFANPNDNLLALSGDGRFLAVSFANGGLMVFDTTDANNSAEIYDQSEFTHFEGGFNGPYFAFSSTTDGSSVFAVVNMTELAQEGGFELDSRIGVHADENGIYLSNKSTVVKIHPVTGEQQEVAYADADVRDFAVDESGAAVVTEKNEILFYDRSAELISRYSGGQTEISFAALAGDYAAAGGRDTPKVRIWKREAHGDADIFSYDASYTHDEARISGDGSTVMLFDYRGFRLYNADGTLVKETALPDAEQIYDQQYSKKSGNLVVLYKDALRIYSGKTGEAIFEQTGLKSVFYAPYGVSIFDADNRLQLIDLDTGETLRSETAEGNYAAYCGMVVDSGFLQEGELIGAAETADGYRFAVRTGGQCAVFDDTETKLFEAPAEEQSEAFFTEQAVILSPLHGTPAAYRLTNGEKISDLEQDAYLTYITPLENGIMSEYVSASGERYGILIDKQSFAPLAYLPGLTDLSDGMPVFDYHKGKLRKTRIYSINELIDYAKGSDNQ